MTLWKALQSAEFPAVLAEVRGLPAWTAETADAVHAALVAWMERALAAPVRAEDQTAAALYDLIGRLRSAHGDAALESARPGTTAAWRGFEELLNERTGKLRLGDSQRAVVLERRHVREVLAMLLAEPAVAQRNMRERLAVSEPILSQVLARMDAAGMIVRERQAGDGRTRLVRLSEEERQRQAGKPAVTRAPAGQPSSLPETLSPRRSMLVSGMVPDDRPTKVAA